MERKILFLSESSGSPYFSFLQKEGFKVEYSSLEAFQGKNNSQDLIIIDFCSDQAELDLIEKLGNISLVILINVDSKLSFDVGQVLRKPLARKEFLNAIKLGGEKMIKTITVFKDQISYLECRSLLSGFIIEEYFDVEKALKAINDNVNCLIVESDNDKDLEKLDGLDFKPVIILTKSDIDFPKEFIVIKKPFQEADFTSAVEKAIVKK